MKLLTDVFKEFPTVEITNKGARQLSIQKTENQAKKETERQRMTKNLK